ncbi:hypothetical protein DFH06DRAFT_1004046, partial [Mycena polygramma]
GMWTLDSASNNDTFMVHLARLIAAEPGLTVEFDPLGNRIRYLGNYADAVASDPVGRGRQIVAACRASGQRRAELKLVIKQGNEKKLWGLRVLQLLRDCETRWSSTYLMSDRLTELYPAIQCFLKHPQQENISHLLFNEEQFQVLSDIQLILSIPHAAQELLSAEKTPTLSLALPAFELLLVSWLNLQKELPELAHYIGVGITKIQEYVNKGRKSRIYALAMIINPTMKMTWIQEYWPQPDARKAEDWMLETVRTVLVPLFSSNSFTDDFVCHSVTPRKRKTVPVARYVLSRLPITASLGSGICCPSFRLRAAEQPNQDLSEDGLPSPPVRPHRYPFRFSFGGANSESRVSGVCTRPCSHTRPRG